MVNSQQQMVESVVAHESADQGLLFIFAPEYCLFFWLFDSRVLLFCCFELLN